jgi:hypothetical protein
MINPEGFFQKTRCSKLCVDMRKSAREGELERTTHTGKIQFFLYSLLLFFSSIFSVFFRTSHDRRRDVQ